MRHILIALFALISLISFGQTYEINFKSEIQQFDISDLWTIKILETRNDTFVIERPEPLGYIGNSCQRFYIHFLSVIKNPNKGFEYFVYGKSKVKSNICSFQGFITIKGGHRVGLAGECVMEEGRIAAIGGTDQILNAGDLLKSAGILA